MPLAPEERGVIEALARALSQEGVELVTVLLGSASYEAVRSAPDDPGATWVLDSDRRGRGLVPRPELPVRTVSDAELVRALMEAERVLSMP